MAMESLLRSTCVQGCISGGLSRLRFLPRRSSESQREKGTTDDESRLRLHADDPPPAVPRTDFSIDTGFSGRIRLTI